ncbi:MAG: hypothetical protein IKR85_00900 [Clostridia bacterium]|nr:hypothetical protein [Clostridia bacterium]
MGEPDNPACVICFDEKLSIELFYDFDPSPLRHAAEAGPGDEVRLFIYPQRIALYVNGELADEEWPCGSSAPYTCAQSGDFPVTVRTIGADDAEPPFALRRNIVTADIRRPGVNIGDCMPYSDETDGDGLYHLFYLRDRRHHHSKWHLGGHQWAHVATKDFKIWNEYPIAVLLTQQWEGSICTGSVIRSGGKWYAWYAVRMADRSAARLTCAVSDDLAHFEKSSEYFVIPEAYEPTGARDPMLFFCGGQYHMLVTTHLQSDGSGCLAHLVNDEMTVAGWRDAGCIMSWFDYCAPDSPDRNKTPECADWFRIGDYYYLAFGIGSVSRYLYSKKPFGTWTCPDGNTIPCGAVPKSAVLPGTGRRIFMGFRGTDGGYAGSLCAAEAFQNADGTLRFEEIGLR